MFTTIAAWSGWARLWSQYLEGVQSQAGIHKETGSKSNQPPTHPIQKPRISCWHPCSEFFTLKLYVALILAFRPSHHFIRVGLGKSSFRTHPSQHVHSHGTPRPRRLPGSAAARNPVSPPEVPKCPRPFRTYTPAPQRESELERTPAQALTRLRRGCGRLLGRGLEGAGRRKGGAAWAGRQSLLEGWVSNPPASFSSLLRSPCSSSTMNATSGECLSALIPSWPLVLTGSGAVLCGHALWKFLHPETSPTETVRGQDTDMFGSW